MRDERGLERAAEHVFIAGVGDLGAELCRRNVTYGLAKIHAVQEATGRAPSACFVGAPDATVTRNPRRWQQGFGYGGLVSVDEDLAILDGKPNACGMLVGALRGAPDEGLVRQAATEAQHASYELSGVPLCYDLGESNHFVDGCQLVERLDHDPSLVIPQHLFIIHSSGNEHRAQSPYGPGLYIDESERLRAMARVHQTAWGDLSVLTDDDAREYYRFCSRVQQFNAERREFYGRKLFGDFEPLCNATHQGFRSPGKHYLGANFFEDEAQLYPLTLGPDQPVYLMRPRKNFAPEKLEQLGWMERAERHDLLTTLKDANILPHGGGYAFDGRLLSVDAQGDQRTFAIDRGDATPLLVSKIRELPFHYRDERVLHRTRELDLGEPVARYRIRFVVK